MNIFKRIITTLIIISLQACGAGTQSLFGNAGNQLSVSSLAIGPSTSKVIEQVEQDKKMANGASARLLDIVVPTFDLGFASAKEGESQTWPELRRAEANLFAVELKKALERTEKFGAVRVTPDRDCYGRHLCDGAHRSFKRK